MAEKELKFKSQSFFTGRNGTFKASAISISAASNLGVVRLVPITTKEKLASCEIAIPWQDCKEFIQAFSEVSAITVYTADDVRKILQDYDLKIHGVVIAPYQKVWMDQNIKE